MLWFHQLKFTIWKCICRYDDGWVGRFCQEVDGKLESREVLLKNKVVLLNTISCANKKTFN
jgi:hypothetical protein